MNQYIGYISTTRMPLNIAAETSSAAMADLRKEVQNAVNFSRDHRDVVGALFDRNHRLIGTAYGFSQLNHAYTRGIIPGVDYAYGWAGEKV